MSFLYILGGIIVLTFVYSEFKKLFIKGEVKRGYYCAEKEELYLLNNYSSWEWSRQGSYETHQYKLEKYDLKTLEHRFTTKLSFYVVRSVFDDIGEAIGLDCNFFYYFINKKRLLIVDMETGKKVAGRKKILKHNPGIKNFNVLDSVYSSTHMALVVNDNTGERYILDPNTLKLTPFKKKIEKQDTRMALPSFNDMPVLEINSVTFSGDYPQTYYFNDEPKVDFVQEKNSDRYFIHIKHESNPSDVSAGKTDFMGQHILSYECSAFPYVDIGYPVLIVVHAPRFNPDGKELIISAVYGQSQVLWSCSFEELFINPEIGDNTSIRYIELKDSLVFIFMNGRPHKISMSKVDKKTGKILSGPKRFINKKINSHK
ncbi:MAG: hypothetical protein C0592_13615 [Marinilabiliales bacterium]|nr:MAG: hypothetical protein C0592_13615 [Marinilabiliales bacterium]